MHRRLSFVLLFALLLPGAGALAADDPAAARAGFARERSDIEAVFRQAEAACRDKFAVNSCLEQARSERRKALAAVRQSELALDDAIRRQRADDRRRAVIEKQAALQQRAASAAASAPAMPIQVRAPRSPASAPSGTDPRRGGNEPLDGGAQAASARASEAAARAQEFAARQARIAQRVKERAAASRPVMPLPLPASAAAATPAPR